MNNRIYRTLALGVGMMTIFAATTLNASVFYSKNVNIPFEFKVGKQVYAPGAYRVEQNFGSDIASLVNMRTGQRIQLLAPITGLTAGRNSLKFEDTNGVRTLKKIS